MFVSKNCCIFLAGDRKRWENLRNVFIITFILYVLLWSVIVTRSLNMVIGSVIKTQRMVLVSS